MRITWLAVVAVVVLAACGAGGDENVAPTVSPTTTTATAADDGELFEERNPDDVTASPGDVEENAPSTDPPTTDTADAASSTTVAPDDGGSDDTGAADTEPTTGGQTGGGDTDGATSSAASTGGDGSTTGNATTGTATTGSATAGSATTSATGGTAIDPDAGDDVCGAVREVGDALDRLADIDGPDDAVDNDDVRAALGDVARSLRTISSPATVAADVELLARSIDLQIAEDLDGRELTEAEEDFLDSDELQDAGDRFDDFAVDACGVELF